MTPKKKVEYLIIGQGLAGSLLSWRLIQQGCSVLVIDPCLKQTASRTAAGLINPVTGKRLVKTLGVEHYLPAAKQLYDELAKFFDQPFFYKKEQIRLFQSEEEVNQWNKRKHQPDYAHFLGDHIDAKDNSHLNNAAFGGFKQKQCGYLDTIALLDSLRQFFIEQGCFISKQVDHSTLKIGSTSIEWQRHIAGKVVFCDGYHLQHNPWFSWLPLQPAQGDILTLKSNTNIPDDVIQFGKWLLPLPNKQLKLGASWQWQPLDEKPNKNAAEGLLNICHQYFPQLKSAQLLEHKTGIRPCTADKQPFLGSHPEHSKLLVFNGFGSKGALMIPWYSERLLRFLTEGEPLPSSADIKRYINDYPSC